MRDCLSHDSTKASPGAESEAADHARQHGQDQGHPPQRERKGFGDPCSPLLIRLAPSSLRNKSPPSNHSPKQCFREWSADGAPERTACFGPLLEELQQRLSAKDASTGRKHRVLVPGAGLGRLPLEIAARGYACQGNEFSYHMLLTSNFLLNCTAETEGIPIAPFIDQTCNLWRGGDNSKTVCIPDVCPGQLLGIPLEGSAGEHDGGDPPDFSMVAGDFQDVYAPPQGCCWDAVVSCFFLDTAPVALEYVETIHRLLKPNGLWINLGPLLYHWAGGSDAGEDARYARSVELGWEEVRHAMVEGFGFELLREDVQRNVTYASNPGSMMRTVYDCVLCTARKSDHGSAREMGKNGEA